MKADPRVDAYIAKAAAFAQPLLVEMRKRIQKALPDATETIKWNVPFYVVNGKLVASMAAFKKHTKFGVWHGMHPNMTDTTSMADLPPAADYAKQLKAAAEQARGGASAKAAPAKSAKKSIAKKIVAKKAPAKRAVAKKNR